MRNVSFSFQFQRNGENSGLDVLQNISVQDDNLESPLNVSVSVEEKLITVSGILDPSVQRNLTNIALLVEKKTGRRLKVSSSDVKIINEHLNSSSYKKKSSSSDEFDL